MQSQKTLQHVNATAPRQGCSPSNDCCWLRAIQHVTIFCFLQFSTKFFVGLYSLFYYSFSTSCRFLCFSTLSVFVTSVGMMQFLFSACMPNSIKLFFFTFLMFFERLTQLNCLYFWRGFGKQKKLRCLLKRSIDGMNEGKIQSYLNLR